MLAFIVIFDGMRTPAGSEANAVAKPRSYVVALIFSSAFIRPMSIGSMAYPSANNLNAVGRLTSSPLTRALRILPLSESFTLSGRLG